MPTRAVRQFTLLSILLAVVFVALPAARDQADAAPAVVAAANLVSNASLEDGDAWPSCFSPSGWGSEAQWTPTAGHTGARAVTITINDHQSGDRKLLQSESLDCAPTVTPGASYDLGIWYRASVAVQLTLFRHTPTGWAYWGDLGSEPAAGDWTQAEATTPVIPADTDRIVFGLSLSATGNLTTDDYALTPVDAGIPQAENLVANPNLATGTGTPRCFTLAGWGESTSHAAITTSAPAGSPTGTRSYRITMANRVSGDLKLIPSASAGCAPVVSPGTGYTASVDYTSTSDATSLTVFQHTADGWSYWQELASLPATTGWSTASAIVPPIPAGVDRISFGVSIAADGVLSTTNYSLTQTPVDDPDDPGDPPPRGPAAVGSWSVLDSQMPLRTIHTTLLHDGRLLLIAGSGNDGTQFAAGTFRAVVWDPSANSFTEIPVPYDMFCAGHVTLPDGTVLIAGGTEAFPLEDQGPNTFRGSKKSYYFDPADDTFHSTGDMTGAHWYPSLTKLGNGDIWAAGGLDEKAEGTVLTEMFDTAAGRWLPQNKVPQTWSFWGTYPHMYLLEDGMLFYSGGHTFGNGLPGTGASLYDWRTAQIWDVPGLREKDMRDQAGSVLLPPAQDQRVMIVGGGNTDANAPGINLVDIIDLAVASPHYVPGPDLPGPGKGYVNLVTLPDRTVLASDGAQYNRAGNVYSAAVYEPQDDAWSSIDPDPVGRNYHSTAILLPDGRVAVLGSNPADNSFELRISVYSPSYLFRGPRPTVSAVPAAARLGDVFHAGVAGSVVSASLMAPLSATHQTDTNARLVDVPISGTGATRTLQIPSDPDLLPPGPYMLTVLDSDGVPSVAKWMWIS